MQEDIILKVHWTPKIEYPNIRLSVGRPRVMTSFRVHQLVAEAFIDKDYRSKDLTVNHKDGDKCNNRVSNFELITRVENIKHAWITGINKCGEGSPRAKLTQDQADYIRFLRREEGTKTSELTKLYGVSSMAILNIINYKTYKN